MHRRTTDGTLLKCSLHFSLQRTNSSSGTLLRRRFISNIQKKKKFWLSMHGYVEVLLKHLIDTRIFTFILFCLLSSYMHTYSFRV